MSTVSVLDTPPLLRRPTSFTASADSVFAAALTGSVRETLAVPVAAYFFAWIAHFVVEKNRPATFIYPVFSLVGDFRMCAEVLLGRHAIF